MVNIAEGIEKIPVSEKVTIVYNDGMGQLTAVNTVIINIMSIKHYQGASDKLNGLMIYHKTDDCSKRKSIYLPYNADFMVYKGYIPTTTWFLYERYHIDDIEYKSACYNCYDIRNFIAFKSQNDILFGHLPVFERKEHTY
jgi:hypothetical protein